MSATQTRESVLAQAYELTNKKPFTREDSARVDALMRYAEALTPNMGEFRKAIMVERSNELAEHGFYHRSAGMPEPPSIRGEFEKYLRYGKNAVTPEFRAQAVSTDSSGGFITSQEFSNVLYRSMKAFDPLFDPSVVTVVETATGASFAIPMEDDASAGTSAIIAENVTMTEVDLSFSQLVLGRADKWSAPVIRCSWELAQDSAFNLSQWLATIFGIRYSRGIGVSNVATLIAGAALGKTGTNGQTTSVIADDVYDLAGSVDPAYVSSPKCAWLMRYATLIAIQKLRGTAGAYFPPVYDADGNFVLLGKRVLVSPSVPAMAANAKSILFGDLSRFVVRRVANSVIVRQLDETCAELGQVGFVGWIRTNAGFVKPTGSDSAVKWYANSAT